MLAIRIQPHGPVIARGILLLRAELAVVEAICCQHPKFANPDFVDL